jgi:hypothetical protein
METAGMPITAEIRGRLRESGLVMQTTGGK